MFDELKKNAAIWLDSNISIQPSAQKPSDCTFFSPIKKYSIQYFIQESESPTI